jgi:hypothetical protein
VAEAVEFTGGNARFHVGPDHLQHFAGKAACDAHFLNFLCIFDVYGHDGYPF